MRPKTMTTQVNQHAYTTAYIYSYIQWSATKQNETEREGKSWLYLIHRRTKHEILMFLICVLNAIEHKKKTTIK